MTDFDPALETLSQALAERGILDDDPCDLATLACAVAIRREHLGLPTTDAYVAHVATREGEYESLVGAVEEARDRLRADELVPADKVDLIVDQLEATVHALERANADRHAASEELKEMDDELTVVSRELDALTADLDERSHEVTRLGAFVDAVVGAMDQPVAVVDEALVVHAWNAELAALCGIRSREAVGRSIVGLSSVFPADPVGTALKELLADGGPDGSLDVDVIRPDGRTLRVHAALVADDGARGAVVSVATAD